MKKFWTLVLICAMAMSMAGQAAPVYASETENEGDEAVLENSGIYVSAKDSENYMEVTAGDSVKLEAEVSDTDYPDDLTWQWYYLDAEGDLTLIEDATESAYTVKDPMSGDCYYVCVYENDGEYEAARNYYYITVDNDLQAEISDAEAVLGESATLTVEASGYDTSDITYQWVWCDDFDLEDYDYIEGANDSSYTIDSVDGSNFNRLGCLVTDRYGNGVACGAWIDVDNSLTVRATEESRGEDDGLTEEVLVEEGGSAQLTVYVSAGDTEGVTYQWEILNDNGMYKDIAGATESTLNTGALLKSASYFCEVTDRFHHVAAQQYTVKINTGLSVTEEEEWMYDCVDSGSVCELTSTAVIDAGREIHYEWYQYDDEEDLIELDVTDSSMSVTVPKGGVQYLCVAYDDYGNYVSQNFDIDTHVWKRCATTAATLTSEGTRYYYCDNCGNPTERTIYRPKTFTLTSASYTYDGKAKKPTLTVKDSKGSTISSSYYTYTAASGTNVGTYTCKVVFKGDYSGTKSLTYKINPKGTSLTKITAASKGFKAYWTKQATQTTGYQIRYATKSDMSDAKTVTISKNTTVSQSVTKLTGAKKYYVQIRTYKTVSKVNYYSAWSKSLTVTTKK